MDVLEAIKGRRSIRSYKKKDVSNAVIIKLINLASFAPSAGNTQPCEFIIVRKIEIKKNLAKCAFNQTFLNDAPVLLVVCANESRSSQRYGTRGKTLYCIQDTAAAIQNILLAAHSFGLSTCWVGAFNENATKEILNIPLKIRPVAIITIGYGTEIPPPRRMRSISQTIHYETFNFY